MTDTLSQYSVLSLYSAMAIYAIAFVLFTLDLAKGASQDTAPVGEAKTVQIVPERRKLARIAMALTVIGWLLQLAATILTNSANASAVVASRTACLSPEKTWRMLMHCAGFLEAHASQTVPTGFSGLPPVGPATPVTATLKLAFECAKAPKAMAFATSSLTAPCCAIKVAGTPSISVLASLA